MCDAILRTCSCKQSRKRIYINLSSRCHHSQANLCVQGIFVYCCVDCFYHFSISELCIQLFFLWKLQVYLKVKSGYFHLLCVAPSSCRMQKRSNRIFPCQIEVSKFESSQPYRINSYSISTVFRHHFIFLIFLLEVQVLTDRKDYCWRSFSLVFTCWCLVSLLLFSTWDDSLDRTLVLHTRDQKTKNATELHNHRT